MNEGEKEGEGRGYYLGIDVGTGSVRAGIVNDKGELLVASTADIKMWNPQVKNR